MKRYDSEDIIKFLHAIDVELSTKTSLIVIGGTAAALGYGVKRATQDIDTWNNVSRKILEVAEKVRSQTGLNIPIEQVGVADAPYEFESRLSRVETAGLKHIELFVPEKHDLALMKMTRGYEHDLATIEELNTLHGLDVAILFQRYTEEMKHIIGDPNRIDIHFLAMIELLAPRSISGIEKRLKKIRSAR